MMHLGKTKFLTRISEYDYLREIKECGRLRFAPLSHYRERGLQNDRERYDEFEGATKIDQPWSVKRLALTFQDKQTMVTTGPIDHKLRGPIKWFSSDGFSHVMCFSIHEHVLLRGKNTINIESEVEKLGDSTLLVHDIGAFVRHVGEFMCSQNTAFECGPVEYVGSDYEGEYSAFKKPERYKHQREYRLAIRVDDRDAVKFTVPRIEKTLEVFKGFQIRFETNQA